MGTIIVILHILVALTLILVVLLQVGKGGSIGAAFGGSGSGGGSSQSLFGSRGPATFLSHLTTGAAAVFMITSLTLAYLSSNARQASSITDQIPTQSAPGVPAPDAPAVEGDAQPQAPTTEGQSAPAPDAPDANSESNPAPKGDTQQ